MQPELSLRALRHLLIVLLGLTIAGDKAVATPTQPPCKEATPSEIE
jgi:hypothetical protein